MKHRIKDPKLRPLKKFIFGLDSLTTRQQKEDIMTKSSDDSWCLFSQHTYQWRHLNTNKHDAQLLMSDLHTTLNTSFRVQESKTECNLSLTQVLRYKKWMLRSCNIFNSGTIITQLWVLVLINLTNIILNRGLHDTT